MADLHTCGLELDKLSELPASLSNLIDVKLDITKRTCLRVTHRQAAGLPVAFATQTGVTTT